MNLYFVPPGEGQPLELGTLITETGEEVEGVMVVRSVWDNDNVATVQISLVVGSLPSLSDGQIYKGLKGLMNLEQELAVSTSETGS